MLLVVDYFEMATSAYCCSSTDMPIWSYVNLALLKSVLLRAQVTLVSGYSDNDNLINDQWLAWTSVFLQTAEFCKLHRRMWLNCLWKAVLPDHSQHMWTTNNSHEQNNTIGFIQSFKRLCIQTAGEATSGTFQGELSQSEPEHKCKCNLPATSATACNCNSLPSASVN